VHFRLKPNHRMGEGVYTNEKGFLAPPGLTPEKPNDRLRVIYVGDSVTALPVPGSTPRRWRACSPSAASASRR